MVQILRSVQTRPITPVSKIFKEELLKEKVSFEIFLAREEDINAKMIDSSSDTAKLLDEWQKCEDKLVDTSHCPKWDVWLEWGKCGSCGVHTVSRLRSGCKSGYDQTWFRFGIVRLKT